jgi:hypothetical protein
MLAARTRLARLLRWLLRAEPLPCAAALLVVSGLCACLCDSQAPSLEHLLERPDTVRPELRRACRLVLRKCTRCHTLDRVLVMRPENPGNWQQLVATMRRMSGSAIGPTDQRDITRCLVYRSFGEPGLQALERPPEASSGGEE